jgi:bisphosphoglycerate-dependent phosphoglycerate mutase
LATKESKFDYDMIYDIPYLIIILQGLLRAALEREEELASKINGFDGILIKDLKNLKGYYSSARKDEKTFSNAKMESNAAPAYDGYSLLSSTNIASTATTTSSNTTNAPILSTFEAAANGIPSISSTGDNNVISPSLIKSLTKLENERRLFDLVDDKSKDAIEYHKRSHSMATLSQHNDLSSYADIFIDREILNLQAFTTIPANLNSLHGIEEGVDHLDHKEEQMKLAKTADPSCRYDQLNYIHYFREKTDTAQGSFAVAAAVVKAAAAKPKPDLQPVLARPLLVIIRHGKTEHNQLGLFTGWEDALLAEEGRDEAIQAGKLLRKHGIEFDVVYASWLSRAIETAWLVLNELDSLWLPVVKTWRLNERMCKSLMLFSVHFRDVFMILLLDGALTGLSKKMIRQIYGDEQFMSWRRGFSTKPPPISPFSHAYPGNDIRYVKYVNDVEISLFETLIRSLAHGKLEIHRNFPKCESLKDCKFFLISGVSMPKSLLL